ncbi:MAG: hypothetical protein V7742_09725 [Halioglobus sp.]
MNWEAIGAVGELVGALAVLVTLVYLSMQIRQNTKSVQAAAVDSANSQVSRIREVIFADADVANMYRRGTEDPASLSQDDTIRYRLLIHNIMLSLSNSITQASVSGLSESRSEVELSILGRVVGTAGGRWFWDTYWDEFEGSFQGIIDDLYLDIYDEPAQKVKAAGIA